MRDLLKVLSVLAVALAVCGAAVFYGGDTTVTVPPPEAVAEQFARQVATRRYDRALVCVDRLSGITLMIVRLRGESLRSRAGAVDQVEGEPGKIDGLQATADAVLTTERAGRVRYAFRLVRRAGVWKIVEWEEIS